MNLGEITHYVADYFTFPHNKIYPGGFKEHCAYEEHLKHELRAFLKTDLGRMVRLRSNAVCTAPLSI